jgi:hypothetical protein
MGTSRLIAINDLAILSIKKGKGKNDRRNVINGIFVIIVPGSSYLSMLISFAFFSGAIPLRDGTACIKPIIML